MNFKLFLFIIAIIFSTNALFAQTLEFSTSDSIYLNETATSVSQEIVHKTYVKNVSSDTANVSWRIDFLSATSGWAISLCDKGTCISVDMTATNSFQLAPGDSSELKMGYTVNNIEGSSYVRVKVTALGSGDPSLFMKYKADIDVDISAVEDFETSNYSLYPNPVKNALFFKQSEKRDVERVEIYNIIGKKVYSNSVSALITSIDVTDLENGIYIAKVFTNDNNIVSTKTFVKK